jgi:DNA polymerase-1
MAIICDTHEFNPKDCDDWEREQIYNGLDCCITFELLEVLRKKLDNATSATYDFSRKLQGPVLEMRVRGVLIDQDRRLEVLDSYYDQQSWHEEIIERFVREGCGQVGFNWRSLNHLKELFYERLGITPIRNRGTVTVDHNALKKMEDYDFARPIITQLLQLRDIAKKVSVLKTEIDRDGRIRTSYNIGGTNTGRLSSSLSEFGTGGNLQNITDQLRSVLIADEGMKFAYLDAEQGESRIVGIIEWLLFGDPTYIDACESGDLHTYVSKLCEPGLPWPGNPEADKKFAESYEYYRHYPIRKLCKSIGHGSNYRGSPATLHKLYKVPLAAITKFQKSYFKAFPAHIKWWHRVEEELRDTGTLTTLTGRKRQFWGRRSDPDVVNEAIAYDPQGSLADVVNNGMLQVWNAKVVQIMLHNHDAIVVQYPDQKEEKIIPTVLKLLRYPMTVRGRQFIIPYGVKTGWNFGEYNETTNPHGLKEWKGKDDRGRPEKIHFLDRPIHS